MRRYLIIFFVGGLIGLNCTCIAQNSNRIFKTFEYQGQKVNYGISLPANFDLKKKYPVAIGPSDVKDENDQCFYWQNTKDTKGWMLIDFPIYEGINNKDGIAAFLNFIRKIYVVEGSKFHTICFSANSAGIFDLVMSMPENFHSITGMAGNPGTTAKDKLIQLKGVTVQFVVGDQDTYWMGAAKDRHKRLIEVGVDSRIEIIKNGKHVLKDLVGEGVLTRMDKLRIK